MLPNRSVTQYLDRLVARASKSGGAKHSPFHGMMSVTSRSPLLRLADDLAILLNDSNMYYLMYLRDHSQLHRKLALAATDALMLKAASAGLSTENELLVVWKHLSGRRSVLIEELEEAKAFEIATDAQRKIRAI